MQANGSHPVDLEGFRASMRAAGIEEIVEPTLQVFREEAGTTFEKLAEAVAQRDTEGVRAAAHSLKSSTGNIWARGVSSMLERMEHAAETGDMDAITSTFGEVQAEFERVMDFLAEAGAPR